MEEDKKRFSACFIAWLNRKIHLANDPNAFQRPTISGLWGNPDDMPPEVKEYLKKKRLEKFKIYLAEVRKQSKQT